MLRPVPAEALAALTHVLAEAFMDDPLYVALAPCRAARARWLHWVMGLFLRVGHRAGCAFCLDAAPEAGVITIVPPERSRVSVLEYARAAPGIPPVGRGAWAFMRRGAEVGLRLAAAHPPGPHWHLLAMGIVPAQQGRGLGGALLGAALDRAAERGGPCYLETASARNVARYERLGFRVERELRLAGLPPLWTMTAPARGASPARAAAAGD